MYFQTLLKNRVDESYEESCKNKNQSRMVTLFGQKIEASGTNWFGERSKKKVTTIGSSGFFDLNETPVNEPVSNQCFFQDLNFPYTEETEMSSEKRGFTPTSSPASCCTAENIGREYTFEIAAAECLVDISAVNQDQESSKLKMCIQEPSSCSCDSYELHVLGISETMAREDECCVSSSKSIDEYYDEKEFGIIKVRRGKRRMKNFQKEILPGLVSLSRNEIREDINILDKVLRSKEYKNLQGKTRRDGKCKDSTKRCVGRRRRRIE